MSIPNTTPTPNKLYNGEMKKMGDTELRIVLLVTRSTLGWVIDKETGMRKVEDWISHSELIKKSGRSSPAVSKAISVCVKNKWIETRDKQGNLLTTSSERKRRRVYYRLGGIFLNKISTKESKVDKKKKQNLPNLTTKSTKVNDSNLPKKLRNTKETLTKETIQKKGEDVFDIFWKAYPKKIGKQVAWSSFNKLKADEKLLKTILQDIVFRKTTAEWLKNNGMFIPYPTTYLNQRRWEDEDKGTIPIKKPYYNNNPIQESHGQKFVIIKGEWKKFAGEESDIEWC